jgi:hypothetical protein
MCEMIINLHEMIQEGPIPNPSPKGKGAVSYDSDCYAANRSTSKLVMQKAPSFGGGWRRLT